MKRKFGNFSDLLSRDEMRSIIGGYGGDMGYCASMYATRSCNDLSNGAMQGWSVGWAQGSCNQYSGSQLWNKAIYNGIPITQANSDTSWYPY